MKLSTEAIVAVAIAVVFAILSLGAIARERGSSADNVYVATSNPSLRQIATNGQDVLGFY